ncbi:MAG: methyltransferase domain-containing protein [Cyanobacteria bacterium P01_A01_bin.105]
MRLFFSLLFSLLLLTSCGSTLTEGTATYSYKKPSADGIGKVYMGREISQVMGHQGAYWLERPSREQEERPDMAVDALGLKPTDTVADIGAGTGFMSFKIAQQVPEGQVFAVDVQPEMIDLLTEVRQEKGLTQVQPILGTEDAPHLPDGSVDLAIMVDAYHEFAFPREMMTGLYRAMKPGGQVVLAEYRAENPLIMIKRLHKMSEQQVKKELTAIGFEWVKTDERLPQQHLLFFKKPAV